MTGTDTNITNCPYTFIFKFVLFVSFVDEIPCFTADAGLAPASPRQGGNHAFGAPGLFFWIQL